jgi:hypothetical protein
MRADRGRALLIFHRQCPRLVQWVKGNAQQEARRSLDERLEGAWQRNVCAFDAVDTLVMIKMPDTKAATAFLGAIPK